MKRILCLAAVLVLCSCSVKENRSVCPCELRVLSEAPLKTEGNVLVSVVQDGEVIRQGMMNREDFEAGECVFTVPRRPLTVTMFSGIKDMNNVAGRSLDIRPSFHCDELYSSSAWAEPAGDRCTCTLTPHKNYVRLFMTVLSLPEGAGMKVGGNIGGYDLLSMAPLDGDFECRPLDSEGGTEFLVKLPRQKDSSLCLLVYQADGVIRNIPIGQLIEESGYSYEDADLSDISITVDLSKSYAFVHVWEWENENYLQIDYD